MTFANDRKIFRDASGRLAAVGADDLGIRSQKALRELGFAVPEEAEGPEETPETVTLPEKTLSDLETSVWNTLFAWVNAVALEDRPIKKIKLDDMFS